MERAHKAIQACKASQEFRARQACRVPTGVAGVSGVTGVAGTGTTGVQGVTGIQGSMTTPVFGFTDTTGTASTTTLTSSSNFYQRFDGTTTQTVILPNATTLSVGQHYEIDNNMSGNLTLQTNGAATLWTIAPNTDVRLVLQNNSAAAGQWNVDYYPDIFSSGKSITSTDNLSFPADSTGLVYNTGLGTMSYNRIYGEIYDGTPVASALTINWHHLKKS